ASFNMGCGQFCTKPGLILGVKGSEFDRFITALAENTQKAVPQVMLNEGTLKSYRTGIDALINEAGFEIIASGQEPELVSQAK
ncbi:aldehyde dehydrogenase (NADP(+)), partial [Acinetobacter baumannii]